MGLNTGIMSNNRKLNVFLPLLFAIVLALGMYLGHKMPGAQSGSTVLFNRGGRSALQETMDLIKVKYVDTLKVDDLQQEAINGLLTHLDPHSIYIPPTNLAEVNEDLEGNFEGIGVEFNITDDTVNVVAVLAGGPSEAAGVLTGDKILKVNDSLLVTGNGITSDKIRKLLRGPKGSEVKVTMLRRNKQVDIRIKRGVIPLYSVDASYLITPKIGYIKISKFAATTYQEFMDALRKLQRQGMEKLVIDLRQNPGGFLDAATRIADEVLDGNKLILYTKGKSYPRTDYKCEKPGLFEKGALAVLTDEGSASASEILAGAIQDWDRGVIIGRRTFGKGLVQEQFDLSNGGALRLTVARYYIPSGRSIQKSYSNGREAYDEDIMNRYTHGELLNKDSIKQADTIPYKTAKGRVVYGGGGITPDIFIPFDTSRFSAVLTDMYTRNTFSNFAYKYYNTHQDALNRYKDASGFTRQFTVTPELYNDFLSYARKDSIHTERVTAKDETEIRDRIKTMLARQLYRTEGFYEVINAGDPLVKRAVTELEKAKE